MPPTLRKRCKKTAQKTSAHFPKSPLARKRIKRTPPNISQNESPNTSPGTLHRSTPRPKQKRTPKTSPHFPKSPKPPYHRAPNPSEIAQPPGLAFTLRPAQFGLIQERISSSLYALIVQAILWNQTRGTQARPILFSLLIKYPSPEDLAAATLSDLASLLQPIGLHNIRAARLIAMATSWVASPPSKHRRYRKLHYPHRACGIDIKPGEVLALGDEREGWEVAHLPGVGRYAIDSFRIFYRDKLRGMGDVRERMIRGGEFEPEWKRVRAEDKDLKAYLEWRWDMEGEGKKEEDEDQGTHSS